MNIRNFTNRLWSGLRHAIGHGIVWVSAITVLVIMATYSGGTVVNIFDFNLRVIKEARATLPQSWGGAVEASLRMLGAERMLLFFEAIVAVRISGTLLRLLLRRIL